MVNNRKSPGPLRIVDVVEEREQLDVEATHTGVMVLEGGWLLVKRDVLRCGVAVHRWVPDQRGLSVWDFLEPASGS